MSKNNGPVAADELRLLIERIERLAEEKKSIANDIAAVFGEAKSRGFCTKTMKTVIKLRAMDDHQRREAEAMLDLYKGALGMLDGTPLGRWATAKATGTKPDEEPPAPAEPEEGAEADAEPKPPEPTIEDARRMGAEAARGGTPVTANPFPARDPRRAAWDEAWCQNMGSDAMDIPEALRPKPKQKKDEDSPAKADGEAGADGSDGGDGHADADHPEP